MIRGSKSGLSISDLRALAARKREEAEGVISTVENWVNQLDQIEQGLRSVSASNSKNGHRGPGRPPGKAKVNVKNSHKTATGRVRNEANIGDSLAKMFAKRGNQPMGISAILDAVQKDGYATQSPNFRGIVNRALVNKKDGRFHRVERGQYNLTAKALAEVEKA
jgi:hypothetical protein